MYQYTIIKRKLEQTLTRLSTCYRTNTFNRNPETKIHFFFYNLNDAYIKIIIIIMKR